MSLAEKLQKMSLGLEKEEKLAQKQAKDKELAPIRDKIIELEDQKFQLDLIKGSLELKKGDNIDGGVSGEGMKEHSTKTEEGVQKESTRIETLIKETKENLQKKLKDKDEKDKDEDELKGILKEMGIENRDQLVENPEFSEEPEVVSYKKAKEQEELVRMSDQALKERLVTLGVNIEGDFSYDLAKKMIDEKLRLIDTELSQEKLKTPEGKEEAIEIIANTLKESLPKTFFSFDEKTQGYKASITSSGFNNREDIFIKGNNASFERWYSAELLPKNIKELEEKYGKEVVKLSLQKAYEDKIQKEIEDFDKQNENNYLLKQKLEKVSPEKGKEAQKAFQEYSNLQNEFRRKIDEKSKELEGKKIEFSSTYPSNYGSSYEDLIRLGYDRDVGEIARGLDNVSVFPAKFDYEKLQVAILKLSENLKSLINSIEGLNTEEDVNKFLYGSGRNGLDSVISEFHGAMLSGEIKPHNFYSSFEEAAIKAKNNYGNINDPTQKLIKSGFKTYDEAQSHLNQKISILENIKKIVLEKIDTAIEATFKKKELEEEIIKNNLGSISNINFEISRIEQNKKEALDLLSNLTKLEVELPQEELVFNEGRIKVPSVEREINELEDSLKKDEDKLEIIKKRNNLHKNKAPTKVFGVTTGEGQWKKEQEEKAEQSDLETKIQETTDKKMQLFKKLNYYISTKELSGVENLVKSQKDIKGKPDEIFQELRIKLNELMDQKVPESIIKLRNEFKELEVKLK